ncbi:MAG: PEP-CTERM sorting domain-containing protein [Deltaproteobacteria bacterium]|nr:PEP-CTERM sorting domain-containing protein [Deltaproteobacteria bacterium]
MNRKHLWLFVALFVTATLAVAVEPALATTIQVQGNYTIGTSGLTGHAPGIVDDLTPNTNFTLSVPTTGSLTTNFLEFDPNGSSGLSSCGTHCIASETVTATFHFTLPTGDSVAHAVTGEFYANYTGPLNGTEGGTNVSCGDNGSPADCIVWNSNDPFTTTFGNGDILTVALNNAHDWDITSTATFSITQPVPEPMSITILGSALLGLVAIRRRRNRV